MHNGQCPDYLSNLLPPTVLQQSSRNLRNAEDYSVIARRTLLYSRSFRPSATELWNSLHIDIRQSDTLSHFKASLTQIFNLCDNVPPHFSTGPRNLSILLARIRNNCSNLNSDLYKNHLVNSPICSCGNGIEDATHYFLRCPKYNIQRTTLFNSLHSFHPLSCDMLLNGKIAYNVVNNTYIFSEVKKHIDTTQRIS
jgi:hypothetical protein